MEIIDRLRGFTSRSAYISQMAAKGMGYGPPESYNDKLAAARPKEGVLTNG